MSIANAAGKATAAIVKALPERFGFTFIHTLRGSLGDVKSWMSGALPDSANGHVSEPYAQHGTTALAVDIISSDAASVGWELKPEGDDEEEIEDHPVLDLWRKPNPMMLGDQLFVGTYISDLLFGEAFWYYPDLKLAADNSAISRLSADGGLVLLDPRSVKTKIKDGAIVWTLERNNVAPLTLDPERLTHFKRFNPYDPIRGLPKMTAIIAQVEGDVAAQRYNSNFFNQQNGVPTGLIVPGTNAAGLGGGSVPLDDKQRKDFLRTFNARHANRRGVGMLPAGWDWKDLGLSQREMDFRGLQEFSREAELALWGVPPFLAGVLDKANYANSRAQKQVYWQGTVKRFLTRHASTINYDFFPKAGIVGIVCSPRWDTVNALLENLKEKTEVATAWHGIGIPKRVINERLKMGWDGDLIADYDDGYLPLNLIPTDSIAGAFEAPPALPPGEDDDPDKQGAALVVRTAEAREQRRTAIWKNVIVRMRDIELAFERTIRSHMKNLGAEALANLDSLKSYVARADQGEAMEIFDIDKANRELRRRSKPHHTNALDRGGESIPADLGLGMKFTVEDPLVMSALAELTHKITRINTTIETALRASLAEGIVAEETINELQKRVQGVMRASLGRARTIARTETGLAFNQGRHVSMKQAGVTKSEWLSSRDPDVRDSHTAEDGNVANLDEPFPVTGLIHPQSPDGPPGEVINCRCVEIPKIET